MTRGFEEKVVRRLSGGNRFVIILRKKIHSKANIKSPFITITNHHHHHFTFTQCGWLMSVAGGSDCKHTCLLIYPFPHHHRHPHHLNHYISFAYLSHHASSSPPLSSNVQSVKLLLACCPRPLFDNLLPDPQFSFYLNCDLFP